MASSHGLAAPPSRSGGFGGRKGSCCCLEKRRGQRRCYHTAIPSVLFASVHSVQSPFRSQRGEVPVIAGGCGCACRRQDDRAFPGPEELCPEMPGASCEASVWGWKSHFIYFRRRGLKNAGGGHLPCRAIRSTLSKTWEPGAGDSRDPWHSWGPARSLLGKWGAKNSGNSSRRLIKMWRRNRQIWKRLSTLVQAHRPRSASQPCLSWVVSFFSSKLQCLSEKKAARPDGNTVSVRL